MKNFAITGVAGYIAPRHLKAIKDSGNTLIAAVDPHDSVGILDGYFPNTSFFTEIERFDRHLEKLRRGKTEDGIDFLTICSPNHLHDAHIRLAFRMKADAICEKPLVLNPWNLDLLSELETEYNRRVYTILQLRLHPSLIDLKKKLSKTKKKYSVTLTYITSRGIWYDHSWKGDRSRSGGIATNIGIHFFDLLIWLFGGVKSQELYLDCDHRMSGFLELDSANIKWFLSISGRDIPENIQQLNKSTFRSIQIDNEEIEFTEGFTDLHTLSYKNILNGLGFTIEDARNSIELVYRVRNSKTCLNPDQEKLHPFLNNINIK